MLFKTEIPISFFPEEILRFSGQILLTGGFSFAFSDQDHNPPAFRAFGMIARALPMMQKEGTPGSVHRS